MDNNIHKLKVGIIGTGKLGTSLSAAFSEKKMLRWVLARSDESESRVQSAIDSWLPIYRQISDIAELPDVIYLSVSDKNIKQIADELAVQFGERLTGKLIIHCSGTLLKSSLDSCKNAGAETAVTHPYQTFFYPSAKLFEGIAWAVDSDSEFPFRIIELLGGMSFKIDLADDLVRGLYHASAVVASNYMNVIIGMAKSFAEKINLPIEEFLVPILRTTLENNIRALSEKSGIPMTGPIARKDFSAVSLHLESLKCDTELSTAYRLLSLSAAIMAKQNGILDKESFNKICDLLKSDEKH